MKSKLQTFLLFKDFQTLPPHVGKPLSFVERRTISKLRLGCLPLRIETGRYLRPVLPENERVCYCNSGEVESEYYVLFHCPMYNRLRNAWLEKLCIPDNFHDLTKNDKLVFVLNKSENVRHTAQYLISVMDLRSLLNKSYWKVECNLPKSFFVYINKLLVVLSGVEPSKRQLICTLQLAVV